MYLNNVVLAGRLTQKPEIRVLPTSGTPVVSFTIAVNRPYRVNDEWKQATYFFDVEIIRQRADERYGKLEKGQMVIVEGELRQDRWENQSGEKRSKVKIFAKRISVIPRETQQTQQEEVAEEIPEAEVVDDEEVAF